MPETADHGPAAAGVEHIGRPRCRAGCRCRRACRWFRSDVQHTLADAMLEAKTGALKLHRGNKIRPNPRRIGPATA